MPTTVGWTGRDLHAPDPQRDGDVLEAEGRQGGGGADHAADEGAGEEVRRPGGVRGVGGVGVGCGGDRPAAGAVRRGAADDPAGVEEPAGGGRGGAAAQPVREGLGADEDVVVRLWRERVLRQWYGVGAGRAIVRDGFYIVLIKADGVPLEKT